MSTGLVNPSATKVRPTAEALVGALATANGAEGGAAVAMLANTAQMAKKGNAPNNSHTGHWRGEGVGGGVVIVF